MPKTFSGNIYSATLGIISLQIELSLVFAFVFNVHLLVTYYNAMLSLVYKCVKTVDFIYFDLLDR